MARAGLGPMAAGLKPLATKGRTHRPRPANCGFAAQCRCFFENRFEGPGPMKGVSLKLGPAHGLQRRSHHHPHCEIEGGRPVYRSRL